MTSQQWLRKSTLLLANRAGDALDLSEFHIKFNIKKNDAMTPNTGFIRVYGLNDDTKSLIQKEYTKVILQAGYENNFGVIFKGDARQILKGAESAIDKYLDLVVADGDEAYNFSIVNTTLVAGATQLTQINAAAESMASGGITKGYIEPVGNTTLPRGKVMYGMARDYLRQSVESSKSSWSVQDGVLQVIPLTGLLPNEAAVLNSQTGLIGIPTQTNTGVSFRCLLNPSIKIGAKVKINESDINKARLDTASENILASLPIALASDGIYRVLTLYIIGDSRGQDWYCDGVGLSANTTERVGQQVQVN